MLSSRLRRAVLSSTTALALGAAALGSLGAAGAQASVGSPGRLAANIPIGTLPASCESAPNGVSCTDAVVAALDSARAEIGLGPYALPANFATLSGAKQIFILTNLDRIAYGLPVITGITRALDSADESAMTADADPDPTALLSGLSNYAWTSNWAGNWANASYAYYEWMYDDGFSGSETSNIDCSSATATGCWIHRRNVLAFADSGTLVLGVSVGTDRLGETSYATTLVWTPGSAWTSYSYTWAQAQADGAGSAHSSRARRPHASQRHSHRRAR
jgi:hypothetical protein